MHPFFPALFLTIGFLGELLADQWSGFDYAQHSSVQLSHAERLISTLDFCGDESILDIGCGDGKITLLLAEKVPTKSKQIFNPPGKPRPYPVKSNECNGKHVD